MSTDNPSAFPFPYPGAHGEKVEHGMSLHTWQWTQFAAAALPQCFDNLDLSHADEPLEQAARDVMQIADAMMAAIAEREQGGRDE